MNINKYAAEKSNMIQTKKSRSDRKSGGVFYTPPQVVERMTENILSKLNLTADPYIRVLDPACGTGLFLMKAFEVLKRKFEESFDLILDKNGELAEKLQKKDIGAFIVRNNLWGADIDPEALKAAGEILKELAGEECSPNLVLADSLTAGGSEQISLFDIEHKNCKFWENKYDYILGNPPYIGHKQVPGERKKMLQQLYKGIYKDKSDISYCFIKKGIDLLKEGGILSFITSRYFMEGPSAEGLRRYIDSKCGVVEIVDFYGKDVFQDAGIATCIITLNKGACGGEASVLRHRQDSVAAGGDLFAPCNFEHFTVPGSMLRDKGWLLMGPEKYEIFSKVDGAGGLELGRIADSYQGIITGCDRAFVVSGDEAAENCIEESLLRPWLKNSGIRKYGTVPSGKYLIYSDFIEEEKDFPNAIKYIERYRDRLRERRECRKGLRKWYQLQWGRNIRIFEAPKIVYPFKSAKSRFAVDNTDSCCSADIYILRVRREHEEGITPEYITALLNSRLFEFYFKCYAKKISDALYDYYPNTVLKMKIPMPGAGELIGEMALAAADQVSKGSIEDIIYSIDREVYKLYGLDKKQIEIVENSP